MTSIVSTAPLFVPREEGRFPTDWKVAMRRAVRDASELRRRLGLSHDAEPAVQTAANEFPVFVPHEYLARIRPQDPLDPLLRQVLPVPAETDPHHGYTTDPLAEATVQTVPGLLHKYHGRALLLVTGTCAVHCRYCFRRHFPYPQGPPRDARWKAAVAELAAAEEVEEVILSGGDPLTVTDDVLKTLGEQLADLPHLRRLRLHTRLPVMIPQRVTDEMLGWLRGTRLSPIVVIHANHAQELDHAVAQALGRLADAGVPVLNQAVLLKGVNDTLEALEQLSRRLLDLRVMPYYLHQLDRVAGAAHFEVPMTRGKALIAALRDRLPGYAVPRYVREEAGVGSKTVLA